MRLSGRIRLAATAGACATLLAGCGTAVVGTAVSVFSDPFKVGGLQATDGPTGLILTRQNVTNYDRKALGMAPAEEARKRGD